MPTVCYRLIVSGAVQGVGFRGEMQSRAVHLGVRGWVRNLDDGTVEALVQGEEDRVEILLEWARIGPIGAKVASVDQLRLGDCPPQDGFRVLLPGW
jgi:acylphosphatase